MKLILLANGYPYGPWEPFLETETAYYEGFDDVYVCAMQLRREHRAHLRPLPSEKFHVCPVPFSLAACIPGCLRALLDKALYAELGRLFRARRLSFSRVAWLFFYLGRSHHEAHVIEKYLKKAGLAGSGEPVVLYSYRFDYQPYVALLLQKRLLPNAPVIARAHRYDLYESARKNGYIPLRPYLLERLDRVILIGEDGRRYLSEKYPAWAHKLTVSRLGTPDRGVCPASLSDGPLRIISCSTVTPVKRVALIAQALANITDQEIRWTHYGDGPLLDELREQCAALPANIKWDLRGNIDNAALLSEYAKTPAHLFVNVSASEGVPVSIMEALSFSIPCLATDVGGTGEIVLDGQTGKLLPPDVTPEALAAAIRAFAAMPENDYQAYRARARAFWEAHCSAEKNYTAFARSLRALGGEGT